MFKNPHLRAIVLAAAMLAASVLVSVITSRTASGTSTIYVSVPDVIILDYFNNINLGLVGQTESHGLDSYNQAAIDGRQQTIDGSGELSTVSLADANLAALRGSDITLTLRNVWAVRGFSSSGKATVSIAGDSFLRKESSSSSIGVSKLQLRLDGGQASSGGRSVSADLKGIQKVNATMGDVLMGLNFSNTSVSGDYTGTITITAVTF